MTTAKKLASKMENVETLIAQAIAYAVEVKELREPNWSGEGKMYIFPDMSAVYEIKKEYSAYTRGWAHEYDVYFTNKAKGYKRFTAQLIHKDVTYTA